MNQPTRRRLITAGLGSAVGATGLAIAAKQSGLIPPDHQGLFGLGETLTYASHRLLTAGSSAAREFDRSQISPRPKPNGPPPDTDEFQRLADGEFLDWKLTIDGLVARPTMLTLADLKALPVRHQITHLACEEGWSYIAEWSGVPLAAVLNQVGLRPDARYIVYDSLDANWWDSIDIEEALHPQTLVAYGMNGAALPVEHGAPARLRVPRQLGYKSLKHLARLSAVASLDGIGDGRGSSSPAEGYSWYAGI